MRRLVPLLIVVATVSLAPIGARAAGNGHISSISRKEMNSHQRYLQEVLREHSDRFGRVRPALWRQGMQAFTRLPISTAWRTRSSVSAKALMTASGPITGSQWTQIGPAPMIVNASNNFQGDGPNVGEIVDIAIDPRGTTDQVVYVATNGGVWKTTDGGTSWDPLTDNQISLSIGALALDPGNPSIVYAGTGNAFDGAGQFASRGFNGVGIYRSTDGGQTWTTVGASVLSGHGITRMVMPAPNVLLVGTTSGLFKSVDGGLHFGNNSPNFDNGSAVQSGFITDLDLDTATASTVYASVANSGLFRSTDSGSTFSSFFSPPGGDCPSFGRFTFAQSTNPNNQEMFLNVSQTTSFNPSPYCGLYQSTNGGSNWTRIQTAVPAGDGCFCGYSLELGVDPQDDQTVYEGFINEYVSTDGGANFTKIGDNNIHDDQHATAFSPSTHWSGGAPTQLWLGNDGGLVSTTNRGSSWSHDGGATGSAMATNLFFQIDMGRRGSNAPDYTYGGTQDTGTPAHRNGDTALEWHMGIDGDGGAVAVDPSNPQVAYSGGNNCYNKTTNGGTSWGGLPGIPAGVCGGQMAVDPNNGNNVFVASGGNLYRSTTGGGNLGSAIFTGSSINDIDMTELDSNVVWLGLNDGQVAVSTNALGGSPTFTTHAVTGAPASQGVTGIAVDPTNTATAVVVYGGLGAGSVSGVFKHVFMTTDGGSTWTNVSGSPGGAQNLPDIPLHSVVIDPGTNPHSIIVASDAGVARTVDGGGTWQRLGVGLPNELSNSLALNTDVDPPTLRVGTYGRSAFELTAPTGPVLAVNADLSFGNVGVGETATRIVQLFNVGSTDLHISSFNRTSGDPDFSIISGPSLPVTVSPGHEIDYTMQFQPSVRGNRTATFQIQSDDPSSPFSLTATGTGVTGTVALSGDLNFGTVARGTSATRDVIVQNTGLGKLRVSNVAVSGDSAFSLVGNPSFPQTILPGSNVTYTVQFAPPSGSNATPRTGTFSVTSDDPDTPVATLPISGTPGVPVVSLPATTLQFGSVPVDDRTSPNSSAIVLEITNQASCPLCDLHVTSLPITGPNASDFTLVGAPTLPTTIGAGGHLDLTLSFNPSADGARTATLTVNTDDPATPSIPVSLSGTGLLSAIGTLPNPIIFGPTVFDPQCGAFCGQTQNATVTNTGQAELIVDGIAFSNPAFSGPGATNPPQRVAPNASFTEPVTFHPTGPASYAVTGTMSITQQVTGTITVQQVVPLCGESVGRGIRVLALDPAGNPIANLDRVTLQSFGVKPKVNVDSRNNALMTIVPPTSCQTLRFQYQNQSLPATDTANQKSSYYVLKVIEGNKSTTVTFVLGANDFKTIVVSVG